MSDLLSADDTVSALRRLGMIGPAQVIRELLTENERLRDEIEQLEKDLMRALTWRDAEQYLLAKDDEEKL